MKNSILESMGAYDNIVRRDNNDENTITRDDAKENYRHCLSIAKEIERIADGELFICPNCGEWISEEDCSYDEAHDIMTCYHCSEEFNSDDAEPVSMFDYFEDVLDITYYSKGRGADDYIGVRIMVACGGPNIYVDTFSRKVELYWWNETASCDLFACDAIDDYFAELWACGC